MQFHIIIWIQIWNYNALIGKLCPGVPLFGFTRTLPTIFGMALPAHLDFSDTHLLCDLESTGLNLTEMLENVAVRQAVNATKQIRQGTVGQEPPRLSG